jgi:glycerol-3-phosphate dehydrogenase subunit C
VRIIERCSAVDGTWGMKAAYYDEGRRYARRLTDAVEAEREDDKPLTVVTDCSLAALRIKKENGAQARHPIELLADAYQLSGWQP